MQLVQFNHTETKQMGDTGAGPAWACAATARDAPETRVLMLVCDELLLDVTSAASGSSEISHRRLYTYLYFFLLFFCHDNISLAYLIGRLTLPFSSPAVSQRLRQSHFHIYIRCCRLDLARLPFRCRGWLEWILQLALLHELASCDVERAS